MVYEEKVEGDAANVFKYAQEEARRFHHEYVGTEHFLLGLLRESQGLASEVLNGHGISIEQIRDAVHKYHPPEQQLFIANLPLTPRLKAALAYSASEYKKLKHLNEGTEHLLLGMIYDEESLSTVILTNLGLSLDELRNDIVQLHKERGLDYRVMSVEEARNHKDPESFKVKVEGTVRGVAQRMDYTDCKMFDNLVFFLQGKNTHVIIARMNYAKHQEAYALSFLRMASETQKNVTVEGTLCEALSDGKKMIPRSLDVDRIHLDDYLIKSRDF